MKSLYRLPRPPARSPRVPRGAARVGPCPAPHIPPLRGAARRVRPSRVPRAARAAGPASSVPCGRLAAALIPPAARGDARPFLCRGRFRRVGRWRRGAPPPAGVFRPPRRACGGLCRVGLPRSGSVAADQPPPLPLDSDVASVPTKTRGYVK